MYRTRTQRSKEFKIRKKKQMDAIKKTVKAQSVAYQKLGKFTAPATGTGKEIVAAGASDFVEIVNRQDAIFVMDENGYGPRIAYNVVKLRYGGWGWRPGYAIKAWRSDTECDDIADWSTKEQSKLIQMDPLHPYKCVTVTKSNSLVVEKKEIDKHPIKSGWKLYICSFANEYIVGYWGKTDPANPSDPLPPKTRLDMKSIIFPTDLKLFLPYAPKGSGAITKLVDVEDKGNYAIVRVVNSLNYTFATTLKGEVKGAAWQYGGQPLNSLIVAQPKSPYCITDDYALREIVYLYGGIEQNPSIMEEKMQNWATNFHAGNGTVYEITSSCYQEVVGFTIGNLLKVPKAKWEKFPVEEGWYLHVIADFESRPFVHMPGCSAVFYKSLTLPLNEKIPFENFVLDPYVRFANKSTDCSIV